MKRLFVLTAILLGILAGKPVFSADLQKGLDAYDRGDYETALKELTPFAEQGNSEVQIYLAEMYHYGTGVVPDNNTAVQWYRLAAEQGEVLAQFSLGVMYYNGKGVTQDYTRAHMWVNIAASRGHDFALDLRDIIEKKMSATQVGNAQKLARGCVDKNYKGC